MTPVVVDGTEYRLAWLSERLWRVFAPGATPGSVAYLGTLQRSAWVKEPPEQALRRWLARAAVASGAPPR